MEISTKHDHLCIPTEILDLICGCLTPDIPGLQAASLTCKALRNSARPMLSDIWVSPAAIFRPLDKDVNSTLKDWPDESHAVAGKPRWVSKPLTICTWLRIPLDVSVENGKTLTGKRFLELISAPTEVTSSGEANVRAAPEQGRKGICWGRVCEQSDLFWIIWQWDGQASWDAYLRSHYAQSLRNFLEIVSPGCQADSRSEQLPFSPRFKGRFSLFCGFYEVRTIYFAPSMTREQKASFEKTHHLRKWLTGGVSSHDPQNMGPAHWCWLRGLRTFRGQLAVAARFMFNWKSRELEETYQATMERQQYSGGPNRKVVDIFMDELVAAGMLGWESLHCNFEAGPWRN